MDAAASYILAARRGFLHRSAEFKRPIETPCTRVCVIDTGTKLCAGCGRSLDEIARWAAMTDAERQHIMRELPHRQARVRQAVEK